LKEDLAELALKFEKMNGWVAKTNATTAELNNGKFERIIEHMNLKHANTYRRFILGLDSIIDTYLDKDAHSTHNSNPNELLLKSLTLRDDLTRKLPAPLRYYENGFTMNQLPLLPLYLDFKQRSLTDNHEHAKVY